MPITDNAEALKAFEDLDRNFDQMLNSLFEETSSFSLVLRDTCGDDSLQILDACNAKLKEVDGILDLIGLLTASPAGELDKETLGLALPAAISASRQRAMAAAFMHVALQRQLLDLLRPAMERIKEDA